MSAGKPVYERSSSFARSFFQAGQLESTLDGNGTPAAAAASAAADDRPDDGMRKQRSRRRMSSRPGPQPGSDAVEAAAATINYEQDGEPTRNLPHLGENSAGDTAPPSMNRQTSWYTDALLQGGTEELSAILGEAQGATAQLEDTSADDDEVLQQYRILAHLEANLRVKDNTGFDMAEYEKRRKLQPERTKGDYSGSKRTKPRLPEPRLVGGVGGGMPRPEEPPLPPPQANRRFVEQRTPKVPELCPGVIVRGQGHVPEGEHVVRCLGCKLQLRVNMLATLVSCADCSTVSPASSTRR
jgi:hypothetical protein